MAVLQSTNVQGTLCVNGVAVGGGKDFKYCCFTASTTFTPTQDLVDGDGVIDTSLIGGGGGGGGATSGFLLINSTQFNTNPGTVNSGVGTDGGGGSVGNFITNITATDACTVTVGAGGVATDGTGNMAQYVSESYRAIPWNGTTFVNDPDVAPSDNTGGDTSFGNNIAYGGGGGLSKAAWCVCEGPGGLEWLCAINVPATRNGASTTSYVGGGAAPNDHKFMNFSWAEPAGAYGCFSFLQDDRTFQWGADYSASVSGSGGSTGYGFYPEQLKEFPNIASGRVSVCSCGPRVWTNNDGVLLPSGRRAGTNTCTIFDYQSSGGDMVVPDYPCSPSFDSSCNCIRDCGYQSLNCGGGGIATGCAATRLINDAGRGGVVAATNTGTKGGDGLVILKWYE